MKFEKLCISPKNENIYLKSYLWDYSKSLLIKKRPAVIICPGGGYLDLSDKEQEPVAISFLQKGYQAFILQYSNYSNSKVPAYPESLFDVARAISTVRENAAEWNIDYDKIILIGFSAGGHLVTLFSNLWHESWFENKAGKSSEDLKPNAIVSAYPVTDFELLEKSKNQQTENGNQDTTKFYGMVNNALFGTPNPNETQKKQVNAISKVTSKTPPTFLWHTFQDETVDVLNTLAYAKALNEKGVSCEVHVFEKGHHGLSLGTEISAYSEKDVFPSIQIWFALMCNWLNQHFE